MNIAQRLRVLERYDHEHAVLCHVERLAARYGVDEDVVLKQVEEMAGRIERWGLDAELRRMARDYGRDEEEVRARYEAATAEWFDE